MTYTAPLAADGTPAGFSPGTSVRDLNTPKAMNQKVMSLQRQRQLLETDWKLNLAFYRGRQYAYFNRATGRVDSLPTEDGDKPRYRVRLVSNQIGPGVSAWIAKMVKTKPQFTATPGDGSMAKLRAAKLAERVVEQWWDQFSLDDKEEEALAYAAIAGQGYWKIVWDPTGGDPVQYFVNPETGQPIVNETLRRIFEEKVEAMGLDISSLIRHVHQGDIRVEVMSPFDVLLDTSAKTFDEAKFAFCRHYMTPDEIRAKWGVDVQPDAVPSRPEQVLPYKNTDNAQEPTVKAVWIGYFRPQPGMVKGRYVVFVEDIDHFLEDTAWPYPFSELPLVKFPGKRVPGSIYDDAIVSDARPMQKELNRSLSQIVEYKNLTIRPRVWAPANSMVGRLTTEPGTVNFYNPINGTLKPEWEQLGNLPNYIFEHVNQTVLRLKEIFGLTDMDYGNLPPNIEAGVAIDLLQEQASDRYAPQIKLLEKALERAGRMMLQLAQKYYTEERLLQFTGPGGEGIVDRFKGADLNGVDLKVEAGSALPRTRAGKQARIESYIDRGVIAPDSAWKYLDVADLKGLAAKMQRDEDQAFREHDKIINGQPINPAAVQDAIEDLQEWMAGAQHGDPEAITNLQQIGDPQAYIQDQMVQPGPADNHMVHLDVHGDFIKSPDFEELDVATQHRFIDHYMAHRQVLYSMPPMPDPQAVKTTLQIKATTGPTVASKILERNGVIVTPEEAAEPPLETWISDSVDKPDDPNAHTAMLEHEREVAAQGDQMALQAQQQEFTFQQEALTKGVQDAQAQTDMTIKKAQAAQAMRHADEMHQARLQQVQAQTVAARKAANRPRKAG